MNSFQRLSNSSFSDLPTYKDIIDLVGKEKKVESIHTKVDYKANRQKEARHNFVPFYLGRNEFPIQRLKFMTDEDFALVVLPNTPYYLVVRHVKEETRAHEWKRQRNIGYSWSAINYAPFNNLESLHAVKNALMKMQTKDYCMCGTRDKKSVNMKKVMQFHKGVVQSLNDKIATISRSGRSK